MVRLTVYGCVLLAVLAGLIFIRARLPEGSGSETVFVPSAPPEAPLVCPWREPEVDLRMFFPQATRYATETTNLHAMREELLQALGRPAQPEEHFLQFYRVFQEQQLIGTVLTHRVKGESGVIELALAVDPGGQVRSLRLQRLREPETIAAALQRADWLAAFAGKTAASPWQLGAGIPDVAPDAKPSAQAIIEGVRSLLIRLERVEQAGPMKPLSPKS